MNLGWKLFSLGAGAAAGFVAKKAVDLVWEKVLGAQKPQGDESDLDLPMLQVVAFSATTAVVSAVTSELVNRKAAKVYGKHVAKKADA
ncbi:MAG: DUF4235 domain-containing protein [Actinomycetaceae bacterium]|nr:DUF4235 domain-containing protein [Arcanobacterium sp.]MDD7505530.1 DUF4235 domain-containing protein [Actinomycetaceae bacterium]MDY6143511.1 DUF4235 domain-containing protein [Arcanobacterium sp.]